MARYSTNELVQKEPKNSTYHYGLAMALVQKGNRCRSMDQHTLRRAAGHIRGTALPGQPGNVGISAHRDTFFRPLRNIQRNDMITLTTVFGDYRYRVMSTRIVKEHDVAVLDPRGNEILTLGTCFPFYFVGPAPYRFIVARNERYSVRHYHFN